MPLQSSADYCSHGTLSATISTDEWSTLPVPLGIGVYQGDPLSVVIFLTVMNTLSYSLHSRADLGYTLPSSSIRVNHLLYADDACVVSSTLAGCQRLLDLVQRWLEWAKLKAKVPKCHSMAIQASTGRRVNPGLSMVGEDIPLVENDSFKFLGMPVQFYKDNNAARMFLKQTLQQMLVSIEEVPLTRQQKLCLFKQCVCPRLAWPLLTEDLPITWLERVLQPLVTKALKRWAGLARSSNTFIHFLPVKRGGLALPSLVSLYKKQQAVRMVQLFSSSDPGVRKAADLLLVEERKRQRKSFRPAALVDELLPEDRSQSRKTLTRAVKTLLREDEADERHQQLCQLLRAVGEGSRSLTTRATKICPECFSQYPSYQCQLAHLGKEGEQHLSPLSRLQTIASSCIKLLPSGDGVSVE